MNVSKELEHTIIMNLAKVRGYTTVRTVCTDRPSFTADVKAKLGINITKLAESYTTYQFTHNPSPANMTVDKDYDLVDKPNLKVKDVDPHTEVVIVVRSSVVDVQYVMAIAALYDKIKEFASESTERLITFTIAPTISISPRLVGHIPNSCLPVPWRLLPLTRCVGILGGSMIGGLTYDYTVIRRELSDNSYEASFRLGNNTSPPTIFDNDILPQILNVSANDLIYYKRIMFDGGAHEELYMREVIQSSGTGYSIITPAGVGLPGSVTVVDGDVELEDVEVVEDVDDGDIEIDEELL